MTWGDLLEAFRDFAGKVKDNPNALTLKQAASDLHDALSAVETPPAPPPSEG